jgi:hypothetical protein
VPGGHPGAKTEFPFAGNIMGLVSPFHVQSLSLSNEFQFKNKSNNIMPHARIGKPVLFEQRKTRKRLGVGWRPQPIF